MSGKGQVPLYIISGINETHAQFWAGDKVDLILIVTNVATQLGFFSHYWIHRLLAMLLLNRFFSFEYLNNLTVQGYYL